jgi:hypothetical protein
MWTTGFWFWTGSSTASAEASEPIDVLYCHVGNIRGKIIPLQVEGPAVYGVLPDDLPRASQYWLVFRYEGAGTPPLDAVEKLIQVVSELEDLAKQRGLPVAGIQLDIDSPTRSLPEYATFLRALKKDLQAGVAISITALLDWFRPGTAIGEVIKEVG